METGVYKSRLKNARRNIVSGFIKQFSGIIITFLIRTVIINALGANYQGINGLFTSILQILNLSDLGFSTAVTFVLYKPIADDNYDEVSAIMAFLKKTYVIIGGVILGIGLIITPFLPNLISADYPNELNIYVLFLIYLFNTVISYLLFAYKSTLLTAWQRDDVVSKIYTLTSIGVKASQLLLLLIFKNFYVYILVMPIGTVINNLLIHFSSKKLFPQITPSGIINKDTKFELTRQVKSVFINRISDIARNSFDDIIISAFLGLTAVTVYDNYYYIFTALIGIMGIVIHSIRASIGNSIVRESVEKNYGDMMKFTFIFMWIAGWFSVCLFCLYQPFMLLWMNGRPNLLLSNMNMALFCLYFYFFCMAHTKGVYLEAKGLFWECRFLYIIEALANLVLNIGLGYLLGITGILLATLLSLLIVNFYGGTIILFKNYYKKSCTSFILTHFLYFLITICNCFLTAIICNQISLNGLIGLLVKMLICLIIPNLFFFCCYCKTKAFKNSFLLIKKALRK